MKTKIKKSISNIIVFAQVNSRKIAIIIVLEVLLLLLFRLPYLNVVGELFSFLLYIFIPILIVYLFKPKKELFLYAAVALFIINIPFSILHMNFLREIIGNLNYFLLWTYIILFLIEFKKENKKLH